MTRAARKHEWHSPEKALQEHVRTLSKMSLDAYAANPLLVDEHANLEIDIAQGGYGRRQVFELVQNGADAMVAGDKGRIEVLLTDGYLYCANEGAPIDEKGLNALLHAYLSVKRGDEIGRFGLGFKSVLGVTRNPQFFSRSVSFGFDSLFAADAIQKVVPTAERFPTLRVATLLDADRLSNEDPDLRQLMEWATSVVRLERNVADSYWLGSNIAEFPAEFLLFSEHVEALTLEDRTNGVKRDIRVKRADATVSLLEGGEAMPWQVFSTTHVPSELAKRDAGTIAAREKLPVIWALPLKGGISIGKFWAFFPLADETTLSGVINAPWKTNDDRTNLIEGDFNKEMLGIVSDLVLANLHRIKRADDPAWHLDVIPARGRESRNWADDHLTQLVYQGAAAVPSIPDQSGTLRKPEELFLHPDGLPREALDLWAAQDGRPTSWCHPSVETRERRPRVVRIFDKAKRQISSLCAWVSAVNDGHTAATYRASIRVAAEVINRKPEFRSAIEGCWILIDSRGNQQSLALGRVFLPSVVGQNVSDSVLLLHSDITSDETLSPSFALLGLQPVTPELELAARLRTGTYSWRDSDWESFWTLVRGADSDKAENAIRELSGYQTRLKVRTIGGTYDFVNRALLPGLIVPLDGGRDSTSTIDTKSHESELNLLSRLGAVAAPVPGGGLCEGEVYRRYRADCVRAFYDSLDPGSPQPQQDKLTLTNRGFAGPLEPLLALGSESRKIFTEMLLESETNFDEWQMQHDTQAKYPSRSFLHPVIWAVQHHGLLRTSLGGRPLHESVGPSLNAFATVLPVAECSPRVAVALGLPDKPADFSTAHWEAGFRQAELVTDDNALGVFYKLAVHHTQAPKRIQCRIGHDHVLEEPSLVTAVAVKRELSALTQLHKPVLFVPDRESADDLVRLWGLRSAEDTVRTELSVVPSGQKTALLDRFPALRFRVEVEIVADYDLMACSELAIETLTEAGKTSESVSIHLKARTIYWLDTLSDDALLDRVSDTLNLRLSPQDRDIILAERAEQIQANRLVAIRGLKSPAEKILGAVGPAAVRAHIPLALLRAVESRRGVTLSDAHVAELAATIYGIDLLKEFRADLQTAGFQTPDRWAGSQRAIGFVRKLGFDKEYAGSEEERRPYMLRVDGPSTLPPLHDFQATIKERALELISQKAGRRRGLVSLPTGAGKTRVVVEALVEAFTRGELAGPVLWIAQSDELCEQAVQAWVEVWHACGPPRQLNVCRLWSTNEAEPADGEAQVVVATVQKMVAGCIEAADYAWLSKASCLVIDEAHHATEKSYTQLLEWQGISRSKDARCPLIGLTATPFRGHSAEETERLVQRFGRTRLDTGVLGDDPYGALQKRGVLAQVKHQLLGGAQLDLSAEELDEIKRLKRLPASVSVKIAENADRNRELIDDISSRPRDWPIIVFASSVEHAQSLSALLALEGIVARPVIGITEPGTRRYYIEGFRRNRIQVLTNYNVLTQGFDAPAVRAIYVARPTFSPTNYQQMIGRGLRGPLNGGKEECLIVNVEDNFAQYGAQLAFRDFEYLWSGLASDGYTSHP